MPSSTRPLRKTHPYGLSDNFRYGKYYYENFKDGHKPFLYTVSATGIPAVATTLAGQGVTHEMLTQHGYWQVFNTTDQAVLPFATAGSGLDISCDLVNNEAVELVPGGNFAFSRLAFVVGTDSDFFFRAKYKLTDVSGADQAVLAGFRKQEAFAVPTSILNAGDGIYTDFAGIGFADAGGVDVFTVTDLNNSGSTVATDTGFNATDSEVVKFEVRVVGGKAIYFINGTRLGNPVTKDGDGASITEQTTLTGAVFTFDSGDTLVPFIFLRHDADIANGTLLQEVEIGHLVDVGLDPNKE
jgi:hypothetical protein